MDWPEVVLILGLAWGILWAAVSIHRIDKHADRPPGMEALFGRKRLGDKEPKDG